MCQDFEPELLQMSWYGPGPARPAIPPMGFGQGMPPGGMVPWGPPGGMPPRPQYQAPAPQPHFEQRPKRVSSKTLKIIIQFHSLQAIPTGPAVTVFVGNITERAPDSMVCNYINIKFDARFNFSCHKVRHLLTTAGPVVSWKRVQGATGKLQVGGCGLYIFLYLKS